MEVVKSKNNAGKKTLAELVGSNIRNFNEVFQKVLEIKEININQLAADIGMSANGLRKMRDISLRPAFISVVKVALGMMLQHEEFYWFLRQANVGLTDFKKYDRYIKENVDRGYSIIDARIMCTVKENDPWLYRIAG